MSKEIKCEFCGMKAYYETYTSGMYVCKETDCILEYAMQEGITEDISEEDHKEFGE